MPLQRSAPIMAFLVAFPLGAQDRGMSEPAQPLIPRSAMPPAGMCRIWLKDVAPAQQPAPTDCAAAIRARPQGASVLFGGALGVAAVSGGEEGEAAAYTRITSCSAEECALTLEGAERVVFVPGYGLAVARAQHAVKELAAKLTEKGVTVKYAIHPVAGRMPGHMNVLLAEAEVPYDQVFEMEDINGEFGQADVAIILGANDVVNPAAHVKGSPIYGMPILEAYKAKTVIVNKRSMASGYAGLDNELFYMDKTMMVFGDAKKVVEDMVKAVE